MPPEVTVATRMDPRRLTYEPSTDFPTLEDEGRPCPHARRWALVALAAGVGLALGLLLGWWLGHEGPLAIARLG
ncbi:MAG: hypothetical protein KatS3mg014_2623 [Actinomycetota bacterium]|nr:MAG: hypothetical protein KatS3mg014_2623 [Actinomycetota bacterium]